MRKKEQHVWIIVLSFAIICAVLLPVVHHANAYERYYGGCQNCHGAFTSGTSPKGSKPGNNNKMDMHTSRDFMENDCDLCHSSGTKANPYLAASRGTSENPGQGCTGCHGREEDAGHDSVPGGRGAGMRQHHWYRNAIIDTPIGPVSTRSCVDCHSDTDPANYTPVGEHVKPPYYGTGDTHVDGPCNSVAQHNINENWTLEDFLGLDNDGDGLYDMNDPDCGSLPLCTDSDNDGYVDCNGTCAPGNLICGDCDDSDVSFNPDAHDLCDGLDNDCDGTVDEDCIVNYATDIQPVWDADCISCHGPDKIKADLDLSSGVSCGNLHNGGFIVPGDSASSLLYQKLNTGSMNQKISQANKDMVRAWIDQGASCGGPGTCTDNDFDGYGNPGDASCANGAAEDCNDSDPNIYPAALELCDGLDNDCDTSVDEDFPNLGMSCTVGVGACESTGSYICSADGLGTECDATAGTPGVEGPGDPSCSDVIDNDCDGLTDAADPNCASCIPTGLPESICDGIDDDCDGMLDEEYVPVPCGMGACTSGSQCIDGIEIPCQPGPPIEPSDITCDGLDGDCDGAVDEDYMTTSTSCGVGACVSTGQTTCVGGVEGDTCIPGTPGVEGPEGDQTCIDTLDNDCDGLTDGVDNDCGANTAPPVRQEIGRPDSAYNDLVEAECRFCHENPDQFPVDPEAVPDRHHLKYNTIARVGTCSLKDTVHCQDDADCPVGETCSNGSDAPFPPPVGENYDCYTCHDVDCSSGDCGVVVFRNCPVCHNQGPVEYTVHHQTDLAQGTLPQGPDCQFCHGDIVTNRDDGHVIPTHDPTDRTPKRRGGTGLPINSRGNGAGACNYCHDDGISLEGVVVETYMVAHHNRGYGFDDTKCDWCHDFTIPFEAQIRICENCHGYTSLHNIQADSDGDGVINPGIEQSFYGHIGNPDDCWGCHGYGPLTAPESGPIIPTISSTSHSVLVEGIDTTVTLSGTAFTNMDGGIELTSDVVATAEDDSSINLTPDTISQDTITVTIPGTLTPGNHRVQAVKQNKFSNPVVISVKPAVIITEVICDKKKRLLTMNGSGFSEKIEGTDTYISAKANNILLNILSWTDTQIKASVSRCSKHMSVTVDSLFGSYTWNQGKGKKH